MSNPAWKEELLSASPIDLGPSQVLALQVHCIEALDEIKRLKTEHLEAYSYLDDIDINLNKLIEKLKAENEALNEIKRTLLRRIGLLEKLKAENAELKEFAIQQGNTSCPSCGEESINLLSLELYENSQKEQITKLTLQLDVMKKALESVSISSEKDEFLSDVEYRHRISMIHFVCTKALQEA